jgi:hypothetical protein
MHPAERITATAISPANIHMFFMRLKNGVIGNKSCGSDPLLVE